MKEPPIDPRARIALIGSWDETLGVIPTDWLDRAFLAANRANRTGFLLTAGQVLDAWDGLLTERQQDAHLVAPPRQLHGPKPTYHVHNLLPVLKSWCAEQGDPLDGLTRLRYALACAKAEMCADNIRPLLESTRQATLYGALTALGVPDLDPPPQDEAQAAAPVAGTWHRPGLTLAR